jgi:predicted ATPase
MGIRCGITLIAGGGFHGKSTLLQALEAGVYNKVVFSVLGKAHQMSHIDDVYRYNRRYVRSCV